MDKEFYDKYSKEFHCANCCMLDVCMKKDEPLYGRCWEQFAKDKITNLEAKLAESEKRASKNFDAYMRCSKKYTELKQQLAEKDQAIESLQELNHSLGQTCNNDAKEIERLREQLEEKDAEFQSLKLLLDAVDHYKQYQKDANLVILNPENCYGDGYKVVIKTDNQTAIEELEKLRNYLPNIALDIPDMVSYRYLKKQIDQQINNLRSK